MSYIDGAYLYADYVDKCIEQHKKPCRYEEFKKKSSGFNVVFPNLREFYN